MKPKCSFAILTRTKACPTRRACRFWPRRKAFPLLSRNLPVRYWRWTPLLMANCRIRGHRRSPCLAPFNRHCFRASTRSARQKAVAQIAAVVGREFDAKLVAHLCGVTPLALDPTLRGLVRSDIVIRQSAAGGQNYAFAHSLLRNLRATPCCANDAASFMVRSQRQSSWSIRSLRQNIPKSWHSILPKRGCSSEPPIAAAGRRA